MKNDQKFTFKEIKELFKQALEELYKNDSDLIEIKASERLLTHWLAIYFDRQVQKLKGDVDNLKVDVEYNRFGDNPEISKRLHIICANCKKCEDKSCTIDMVFHERTNQNYNVLCVEIKPSSVKEDHESVECDVKRIEALMGIPDYSKQPKQQPLYLFGVAVHFISSKKVKCKFYDASNLTNGGIKLENIEYKIRIVDKKTLELIPYSDENQEV